MIALVDKPRYGLAPALLASLNAEQAITLNYDRLFELAAADAQLPRRVIPGPSSGDERWVLKLHGTVTDPESIVLTRADYLGFDSNRSALSSLVKATLMTRRLLFFGFGMSDAHFHEIVHDVRRALPATTHSFGTVLTLHDDPVTQRLWEGDLEFVVFDSPRTLGHIPRCGDGVCGGLALVPSRKGLRVNAPSVGLEAREFSSHLVGFGRRRRAGVSGMADSAAGSVEPRLGRPLARGGPLRRWNWHHASRLTHRVEEDELIARPLPSPPVRAEPLP